MKNNHHKHQRGQGAVAAFSPAVLSSVLHKAARRLAYGVVTVVLAMGLTTGCHTAEGFGQDLEDAGEAIEEEAEEHS